MTEQNQEPTTTVDIRQASDPQTADDGFLDMMGSQANVDAFKDARAAASEKLIEDYQGGLWTCHLLVATPDNREDDVFGQRFAPLWVLENVPERIAIELGGTEHWVPCEFAFMLVGAFTVKNADSHGVDWALCKLPMMEMLEAYSLGMASIIEEHNLHGIMESVKQAAEIAIKKKALERAINALAKSDDEAEAGEI